MDKTVIDRHFRRRLRRFRALPLLALACLLVVGCSETPSERRAAIYELRAEPSARNTERIRVMLGDENRDVRATALNALVGLRVDDAAELAAAALDDGDGFVRATAAKLAADLGAEQVTPRLVEMLRSDVDPIVRQRAAEALTRFGGPAAVDALSSALGDPSQAVRLASVSGLRRTDPGAAIDPLARIALEDEAWEIRVQAIEALGRTTELRAADVLRRAATDDNEFVRSAAANALRVHEALVAGESP